MGKSYRRPYSAITGTRSAKKDKQMGARGMRRAQDQSLKGVADWDEWLLPDIYECKGNETYSWGRDGCQSLRDKPPTIHAWEDYDKEMKEHNDRIAKLKRK